MKLIDLSQMIQPDMPMFSPTAPTPQVSAWMSHADADASGRYQDCTCEITQVEMVTSIGTYLDSPFHFDPDGTTIEGLSLEQTVLPGVVVRCMGLKENQPIGSKVLDGLDVGGKAVLLHTGWSEYWGADKYYQYPFISRGLAEQLRDQKAALVGVDFLAADDVGDPTRPAHTTLLRNNILIVENLTNLDQLPDDGFMFHAALVKVAAAAFPVRAYGVVGDTSGTLT